MTERISDKEFGELTRFIHRSLAFKDIFIRSILEGKKTQTARSPGSFVPHPNEEVWASCKAKPFTVLKIVSSEARLLGTFDEADAKREGFESLHDFKAVWKRIHPRKGFDPETIVRVYHFEISPNAEKIMS